MMINNPYFDYSDLSCTIDAGLPCFVDTFDTGSDDLGDWWLDLGSVDLTSPFPM
jgi:hypothetical protein